MAKSLSVGFVKSQMGVHAAKFLRSCLVSTKNERNEGNGGHLKVVEG